MNRVFIYHHNDLDGITSGGIVYNNYKNFEEINIIPIDNYSQILDMNGISYGDIVYFVDYSFTNKDNINNLHKLVDRVGYDNIYWIDHHGSSLSIMEKEENKWMKDIKGIVYDGVCGAVLTYLFIISESKESAKNSITNFLNRYIGTLFDIIDIPEFIRYVNSWDIFKLDMPNTIEFKYGAESVYCTPAYHKFKYICNKDFSREINTQLIYDCISDGLKIKTYINHIDEEEIRQNAFETELEGYKVLAINRRGSSQMFGDLFGKYDMVCPFYYSGREKKWFYSLYTSKNIDTSKISEKFGGGGHKKASGFQLDKMIFK